MQSVSECPAFCAGGPEFNSQVRLQILLGPLSTVGLRFDFSELPK